MALALEYLEDHAEELTAAEDSMGSAPESKSAEEREAWAAAFRARVHETVAAKARARGAR